MWVFLNDAFFSIVADRDNTEVLVVRARIPGDLERAFGTDIEVIESDDSDYRFRAFLYRDFVSGVISNKIMNIDYDNFKSSIGGLDGSRSYFYLKVWSIMEDWQSKLFGRSKNNWYLNYRNR
jgi:hypothetical protein